MQESAINQPNGKKEENDFLDYLEIIARGKKLVLTVTLVAFALSIVYALLLPKIYSATARFLPPKPGEGLIGLIMGQMAGEYMAGGGMDNLENILGTGTLADQYASILQSEAIKDPIIDRYKLMAVYHVRYRLDMYKMMENNVKIEAGKKDGIVNVTVENENPKMAADIANAYVDELDRLIANMSVFEAAQNRSFLERRLIRARADLALAEEALKEFQSKNKVLDVPAQATVTIEGLARLKAQLAVQEVQLSTLRRTLTDSSQEVKDASASVSSLKSQVSRLEGGNSPDAIPAFGSIPSLGQEYVRLMREFKTQEMLVDLLTKQYELAKMTEAKDINTILVIQRATVPDKKIKPKRTRIVILITFFAFALSVGLVVARFYFDNFALDKKLRIRNLMMDLSPRLTSMLWKQGP